MEMNWRRRDLARWATQKLFEAMDDAAPGKLSEEAAEELFSWTIREAFKTIETTVTVSSNGGYGRDFPSR